MANEAIKIEDFQPLKLPKFYVVQNAKSGISIRLMWYPLRGWDIALIYDIYSMRTYSHELYKKNTSI